MLKVSFSLPSEHASNSLQQFENEFLLTETQNLSSVKVCKTLVITETAEDMAEQYTLLTQTLLQVPVIGKRAFQSADVRHDFSRFKSTDSTQRLCSHLMALWHYINFVLLLLLLLLTLKTFIFRQVFTALSMVIAIHTFPNFVNVNVKSMFFF